MISEVLALLSTVSYGLSAVFVRKELDKSTVFGVSVVVTVIGNMIFWPLALVFTRVQNINLAGVAVFALAGALAPGIGRLLYYGGMRNLGASANSSIFAVYPLFSSIIAIPLLNEIPSTANWFGIAVILLGVMLTERSSARKNVKKMEISRNGLLFSVLASLIVGASYALRKKGLILCGEPLLGLAIGYFFSFLFCSTSLHQRSPRASSILSR